MLGAGKDSWAASSWTSAANWGSTISGTDSLHAPAVHLIISPSPNASFHSQVLWLRGENGNGKYGEVRNWRPTVTNYTTAFPTSNFPDSTQVANPGRDLFCSSHLHLADSRVAIFGGTAYGDFEVGKPYATTFDPMSFAWDTTHVGSTGAMGNARWYPGSVKLGSSKALVASGSRYFHIELFGGDSMATAVPSDRDIHRVEATIAASQDASISPPSSPSQLLCSDNGTSLEWPLAMHGHAVCQNATAGVEAYFGGALSNGTYSNDVWFSYRDDLPFGSEYSYSWTKRTPKPGTTAPAARMDAAFGVISPNGVSDDLMVVGGRGGTAVMNGSDDCAWVFGWFHRMNGSVPDPTGAGDYKWTKLINISGIGYGAAAAFDPAHNLAYVFGGADTIGLPPRNRNIRVISYTPGDQMNQAPTASLLANLSISNPLAGPSPRRGHCFFMDPASYTLISGTDTSQARRAILFGGRSNDGSYPDTLYALWFKTRHNTTTVEWQAIAAPGGTSAGGRERFGYAYAEQTQRLYIFGGEQTDASGTTMLKSTKFIDLTGIDKVTSTFSPVTFKWTSGPTLAAPSSGLTAIFRPSVSYTHESELLDPTANNFVGTWSAAGQLQTEWFPFMFTIPAGIAATGSGNAANRVFNAGPNGASFWFNPTAGSGTNSWGSTVCDATSFKGGSAVMYRIGKIMKCGSRDTGNGYGVGEYGGDDPLAVSEMIDLNTSTPTWQEAGDMGLARVNHNLVLLPTGDVMAVGGLGKFGNFGNTQPASVPEIWDATNHVWTGASGSGQLDSNPLIRGYHGSAILLADGRVLSASGNPVLPSGHEFDLDMVDIFTPPYLYSGTALATRPLITFADTTAAYDGTIAVNTDVTVDEVVLLDPGSATHGFNPEQRYVPLTYSSGGGGYHIPADRDSVPPGYYYLFALKNKVPSIAKWIYVGSPRRTLDLAVDCPQTTLFSLTWTAPVNGLDTLRAVAYDLRGKTSAFAVTDPPSAGTALSVGTPTYAGARELYIYSGEMGSLTNNASYYFRLRTKNSYGMWSPWKSLKVTAKTNVDCSGTLAGGSGGGGGYSAHQAGSDFATHQVGGDFVAPTDGPTGNSLLDGLPDGLTARDALALDRTPSVVDGHAMLWLRQDGGRVLHTDHVRLVEVDHAAGTEAVAVGAEFEAGTRSPAQSALIRHPDGSWEPVNPTRRIVANAGDVLEATLSDAAALANQPLMISGSAPYDVWGADSAGFVVWAGSDSAGWSSLGRKALRRATASVAVANPGAAHLKLSFLSTATLEFVGSLELSASVTTRLEPSSVVHSDSGEVAGRMGASGVDVTGGGALVSYFNATPDSIGATRTWFLELEGSRSGTGSAGVVGANAHGVGMPEPVVFGMSQNRPNPFRQGTSLRLGLPERTRVSVVVYDLFGRKIRTLSDAELDAGYHTLDWNGADDDGRSVHPGVYLCRLKAGSRQVTRQMVRLP